MVTVTPVLSDPDTGEVREVLESRDFESEVEATDAICDWMEGAEEISELLGFPESSHPQVTLSLT